MTGLDRVSKIVWEKCAGIKRHNTGLIVTDEYTRDIAESLFNVGKNLCSCEIVEMKNHEIINKEPPESVLEKMLTKDVIIIPTNFSMTHTKATKEAAKNGAGIITLPTITKETFLRAIDIDYGWIRPLAEKLKEALNVNEIHIETDAGTDLFVHRGDRNIINSCGMLEPGKIMNVPAGEVFFSPLEGKTEGKLVIDASCAPDSETEYGKIGIVKRPFRIDINAGEAIDCQNDVLWKCMTNSKNGTNVAECAVGMNPKAKITGNILEDEKVLGTSHIAFGNNANIGGNTRSDIHLDAIFRNPTIHLDGKTVIRNGKILL